MHEAQRQIRLGQGDEALPDLNEQPANYHDLFQMHEAQREINLVNDCDSEALEELLHEYDIYAGDLDIIFDEEELEDSSDEGDETANRSGYTRSKDLTTTQRQHIYEALLERSNCGKLRRNATKIVAELFNVNRHAVWRIWRRVKQCRANGLPVDIRSRKLKNSGRKKVEVDLSHVAAIPLHKRSTIRSLAEAVGMKKSTIHKLFKEGLLRRHSSTLKPYLKEENKRERLWWCLAMLDPQTLQTEPKFIDMENIIHLDEKWYYITKKGKTYYLLPQEEDPYRTVHNKNCIDKVMFLVAVAKPRYDNEGNCIFDGKIGIWPFIRKEPAKRRSGNRARGTLVTKTMKVDRDTIRSYMITKLLPAIVNRWPREDAGKTIWIQQDNARTHVPVDDEQFARAVAQTGLDIRLINQPANSPDMNVLDLGFFASLQSLTNTTTPKNIDELIANVEKEYQKYDPANLRNVFLTLQGCLIEVMKAGGGNKYKIPHMNKDRLEAMGILPKCLNCDRQLYESV
ncbi:unnamed protein product, partial [Urochloa humidicola]